MVNAESNYSVAFTVFDSIFGAEMVKDIFELPKDDIPSFSTLQEVSVALVDTDGEGRIAHDDLRFEDVEYLLHF